MTKSNLNYQNTSHSIPGEKTRTVESRLAEVEAFFEEGSDFFALLWAATRSVLRAPMRILDVDVQKVH